MLIGDAPGIHASSDGGPVVSTIGRALAARVAATPDAPFIKAGDVYLTFADVDQISDRLAGGLTDLGVGKGDRIGVLLPSRQETLEVLFACAKLGAIVVPFNPYLRGEFLRHQIADSGAEVLVADAEGRQAAIPLLNSTAVRHVVAVDATADLNGGDVPLQVVPYNTVAASTSAVPEVSVGPMDLISIMYTSGTTGPSKGCMMSHGYYLTMTRPWVECGWVVAGDRVYTGFPLYHTGSHLMLMFALSLPETAVCFETAFSASQFIKRAAADGATLLFGVGSMAMAMLAQPPQRTDSDHPFRLAAFPPMHPDAQSEFEARFATPVAAEGIGQTECTAITLDVAGDGKTRGANGKRVSILEVGIVDDNDEQVPVGVVGELVYRPLVPHAMFSGYWNNPAATTAAWSNLWHHSGDYFRCDDAGNYRFIDRKKDALRRRGENVSSFELEAVIIQHPKIAQVAVCGVEATLGGDDIKACIVTAPGTTASPEELFTYFKEKLPYYAIPRYVELRAELPVTAATGRVQKHLLRAEGVTESTWDLEALGLTVAPRERR